MDEKNQTIELIKNRKTIRAYDPNLLLNIKRLIAMIQPIMLGSKDKKSIELLE